MNAAKPIPAKNVQQGNSFSLEARLVWILVQNIISPTLKTEFVSPALPNARLAQVSTTVRSAMINSFTKQILNFVQLAKSYVKLVIMKIPA